MIRRYGAKAGIAINPETKFEAARRYLPKVDTFLVMGVRPGFGGQKFIRKSLLKIRAARREIDRLGLRTLIAVDGGMNINTGRMAVSAGADELVAGTALFKSKDVLSTIKKFRELE